MKKTVTYLNLAIVVLLLVGTIGLFLCEKKQNQQMEALAQEQEIHEEQIEHLKNQISELQASMNNKVNYDGEAYNYLAIGNSITLHGKCDYWWNEIGMAATDSDKDYFHLVTDYLEKSEEKVTSYAVNFYTWEVQSADRAETYSLLDPYLSDKLDLVTIQLSENVTDLSNFEKDLEELIRYVGTKCSNAQIILIDEFWSEEKSNIKRKVSENFGGGCSLLI